MVPRQHGLGVGADLVRNVARAAEHPVAAHDDEVDFAALHEVARRVVGDDMVRDALLRQFPRGERGTLATRPRLVAKNVEPPAFRLRGVQRRGRRAHIHEGQPSRVAVGQHPHPFPDQRRTVCPQFAAMPHVVFRECLRRTKRQLLPGPDPVSSSHRRPHPQHRVHRIHRGRTRFFQGREHPVHVPLEPGRRITPELAGALGKPIRRGGTDRSRAPHHHVPNRGRRGTVIGHVHHPELVRQQSLLDQADRVFPRIERHRPEMAGLPAQTHVHRRPRYRTTPPE